MIILRIPAVFVLAVLLSMVSSLASSVLTDCDLDPKINCPTEEDLSKFGLISIQVDILN